MVKINNISKQFADKTVLKSVSFNLSHGEIIGLIGENGSGKTTILKIINGSLSPDDGRIEKQNETIGYLGQNPDFPPGISVGEFLRGKINSQEEYKIELVLRRVGLFSISFQTLTHSLSGGEKTRLYLASLLIADPTPTTLLLDEPTNNLDIDGINWLEEFLTEFGGNVILVSHDRSLLDNVADKIIELSDGAIKTYGGNYSFYREQKEIEEKAYERLYVAQQKKIAKIEEDIKTTETRARQGEINFGSGMPYQRRKIRKSAQQSVHRKKKLQKFLSSEKRLEKPEEKIKYFISLAAGQSHSEKTLIYAKNIDKSFGEKKVLDKLTFHLSGGERVWLAGLNGSGKSTLMKIIIGKIKMDGGSLEIGNNIKIGYFSQDHQDLDYENTVLDEFLKTGLAKTDCYKLAISFSFQKEELTKKIKDLSMGQRAKVAFAKLTTGQYQLLVLDEPTNHLEIKTREVIEEALNHYRGGLLVASHDRFFLERIGINKIINLT
ncbi:ABC-F family ATP-binding cassette domain-containing protein [Candidatus Roizmanbacteria bacterium]|nr:ABC-F family ATP-binding cassette domain-containing protein [Candidatus Roizmanbacteria bacterium]